MFNHGNAGNTSDLCLYARYMRSSRHSRSIMVMCHSSSPVECELRFVLNSCQASSASGMVNSFNLDILIHLFMLVVHQQLVEFGCGYVPLLVHRFFCFVRQVRFDAWVFLSSCKDIVDNASIVRSSVNSSH